MYWFGRKEKGHIKELERQVSSLSDEVTKKDERIKYLQNSVSYTERQVREQQEAHEKAQGESKGEKWRLAQDLQSTQKLINELKTRLAGLQQQLDAIKKAEETSKQVQEQLLMKEREILDFVRQTKLLTALIIKILRNFMKNYEFMHYNDADIYLNKVKLDEDYFTNQEKRKKLGDARANFIFRGGNYSKEQREEAKKRGVNINDFNFKQSDILLQQSLVSLV